MINPNWLNLYDASEPVGAAEPTPHPTRLWRTRIARRRERRAYAKQLTIQFW
jgi:hypothetical protein